MVETKLLAVLVIAVVVFSVWLFFVVRLDKAAYEVVGGGLDAFAESGTCTLGTLDNTCSKITTEAECANPSDENLIGKCKVCVGEINGARVTTCTLSACQCGNVFYSDTTVEIGFEGAKRTYKSGETLEVKGVVSTHLNVEKMGAQVRLSFLDGGKNSITRLGPGETVTVIDRDGNFEWTYKIPEAIVYTEEPGPRGPGPVSVSGEYHLLAEFGDSARDVESFTVE